MKDLIIIGAGGFGNEVACIVKRINKIRPTWNFIGFADVESKMGQSNSCGTVVATDKMLNEWQTPLDVVISIGTPKIVRKIANSLTNPLLSFPNIIEPQTIFYDPQLTKIGKGNIFAFNCIVSCDIVVGDYNLFNNNTCIGHDAVVGSYNVVMPSVNISGSVKIGDENFFGVNSSVLQGVEIGNNIRLGAGSVLMRKTKDDNLYVGNPAVKIKL